MAKEALISSRKAAAAAQRACLQATDLPALDPIDRKGGLLELPVRLTNECNAVARDVATSIHMGVLRASAELPFDLSIVDRPTNATGGTVILPGRTFVVAQTVNLKPSDIDAIVAGQRKLYLFGWLWYADDLTPNRAATICQYYEYSESRWKICKDGESDGISTR